MEWDVLQRDVSVVDVAINHFKVALGIFKCFELLEDIELFLVLLGADLLDDLVLVFYHL